MKVLFVSLFIFIGAAVQAQVLNLDTVKVSKVIYYDDHIHYGMGDNNGPGISLYFSVVNTTDSVFYLYPSTSNFFIEFSYNGKSYASIEHPLYLMRFFGVDSLAIQPGESYHLLFGTRIFLGTDILYKKRKDVHDYSLQILQTLPTLRLIYRDKVSELSSKGIDHVKIVRYEYTSSINMENLPKLKQKAGKVRNNKQSVLAK